MIIQIKIMAKEAAVAKRFFVVANIKIFNYYIRSTF